MNPEFPFIASGALLIAGGAARSGGFPKSTLNSLIGTAVLALIASATVNTQVAPLIRAIGMLYLLAVIIATIKVIDDSKKKAKKGNKK